MNGKYLTLSVFLLISFVTLPQQASSGFRIGGWLGKQIEKGKGLFGKPMELATESSLRDMQSRLDANIDHLDLVMAKNVTQFTTQLDQVFKSTTDRLDSLLQNNITELNHGLANNIDNLDISINETLATVRYEQSVFDQSLWVFTKLLAQLALLILTVYFVFLSYSQLRMQRNGFPRKQGLYLFFKRVRFYIIGLVFGIIIVFLFRPLTGSFIDKKFERQKEIVKDKIKYSISHWLYKEAIVNTTMLTKYEPDNNFFEYGRRKAILLKELFLDPAVRSEGNEDLISAYGWFNDAYNKYKPDDPEYFVLDGLFKKRVYDTKRGMLLAAYSGLQYLKFIEPKLKNDLFTIGSLKPIAVDLISNYSINPYDSLTLKKIVTELSLKITPEEFHLLSGNKDLERKIYTLWSNELANIPITKFNENVYSNIRGEQNRLFMALSKGDFHTKNGNSFSIFVRWMQQMTDQKYWSHKALILDDAIDYGIRKYQTNKVENQTELELIESEIVLLKIPAEIMRSIDSLSIYKRLFLARAINQSSGQLAKAGKAAIIVRESLSTYSKIDSLFKFDASLIQPSSDDIKLNSYTNIIRIAAELNLYYETENELKRLPLSFYYINKARNTIPYFYKKYTSILAQWEAMTNNILEKSYFLN